jgi:hypothetical protein
MSERAPHFTKLRKHITELEVPYRDFDGTEQRGHIEVARLRALDIKMFFDAAFEMHFPFDRVVRASDDPYRGDDARLMAANATSGFNYRPVAAGTRLSKHATGNAIDVNPMQNPFVHWRGNEEETLPPGALWRPSQPGTLHKDHELVHLMEGMGWEWAGRWTFEDDGVTDYQHFEWQHDDDYSVRKRFMVAVHGIGSQVYQKVMLTECSDDAELSTAY